MVAFHRWQNDSMAGRKTGRHGGLEFRAGPDYWLRRWIPPLRPFFFESHNPSFRVDIRRVAEGATNTYWPVSEERQEALAFDILFSDQTSTRFWFPKPDLAIGESISIVLREVFTASPGQTILTLPTAPGPSSARWETLYSYQVRTEEQLLVSIIAGLLAILSTVGATSPIWLRLLP